MKVCDMIKYKLRITYSITFVWNAAGAAEGTQL